MNISNTKLALMLCMGARITAFLWGHRGIGKSALVEQLTQSNFHFHRDGSKSKTSWGFTDLRMSQLEACDIRGLPDKISDGYGTTLTVYLPPAELPHGEYICLDCEATFGKNASYQEALPKECEHCGSDDIDLHRGILFLDELNRAADDVLQAAFQLVNDYRIGLYRLPTGWYVVCAGNYMSAQGSAGQNYMVNNFNDEAFLDRFCHLHVTVGPDYADDWSRYLYNRYGEAADRVMQYTGFNKRNIIGDITGDLGFSITPSSRAWDRVIQIDLALRRMREAQEDDDAAKELKAEFPTEVVQAVFAGLVGQEHAVAYMNFNAEVTPKDILDKGFDKYASTLKKWERSMLAGLVWGLASAVADIPDPSDKTIKHTLDFMSWLCSDCTEKDLAVSLGRQLVRSEANEMSTAVLANENVRNLVLKIKGKLASHNMPWLKALHKRRDLSDIMKEVTWGSR